MIQLRNVTLTLGGQRILNRINLELSSKKTHVLIGSSGSGKSTILKLILGIHRPDTGQVTVNNTNVSPKTRRTIVSNIGYVVQDGGLFPHLTVKENVLLVPKLQNNMKNIEKRFDELINLVQVKPAIVNKYPQQISGGQKQRVSLMRALINDPEVLLMDEPLGALDPIVRSTLQEELKTIFDALDKTVILVTHDIGEAAHFGDTVTLLSHGEIVQTGQFRDFIESPKSDFVSKFLRAQKPNPFLKDLL